MVVVAIGIFMLADTLYLVVNRLADLLDIGFFAVTATSLPKFYQGMLFDYDLDGHQDLVLANGHIEPEINVVQRDIQYAQMPQLFWNDGEGQLRDVSNKTGGLFAQSIVARGLAVGDTDRDADVVVTTNGGPVYLLRNDGPMGNSITVLLRGRAPNLDAIGALVTAVSGDLVQEKMVRTGSSYLSHSSTAVRFGIGARTIVEELRIRWPGDGEDQVFHRLEAGFEYQIQEAGSPERTPYHPL